MRVDARAGDSWVDARGEASDVGLGEKEKRARFSRPWNVAGAGSKGTGAFSSSAPVFILLILMIEGGLREPSVEWAAWHREKREDS